MATVVAAAPVGAAAVTRMRVFVIMKGMDGNACHGGGDGVGCCCSGGGEAPEADSATWRMWVSTRLDAGDGGGGAILNGGGDAFLDDGGGGAI